MTSKSLFNSSVVKSIMTFCFLIAGGQAHAWTKLFDCVGSNAVIDRETPVTGPEDFQIVFRDQEIIGQLLQSGAVDIKRMTSLNEIVLIIRQNVMNPREFIGEADSFSPSGVVYFVKPEDQTILFEAFRTTQSTSQSYIVLDKVGSWRLQDCRQPQGLQLN
jgi:hypothetical protein